MLSLTDCLLHVAGAWRLLFGGGLCRLLGTLQQPLRLTCEFGLPRCKASQVLSLSGSEGARIHWLRGDPGEIRQALLLRR